MNKPHRLAPIGQEKPQISNERLEILSELDRKVHWLSAWTIHNANHLRDNRDGLKVGGHQASSASSATILSALYLGVLRPERPRGRETPCESRLPRHPVPHGQAKPRSAGEFPRLWRRAILSVAHQGRGRRRFLDGLGRARVVAITSFASIIQDYLLARDWLRPDRQGRMVALLGDAELDEGNIYEALIEGAKHELRNTWWIVDYNRQSLDATTPDRMFDRYDKIFAACGWDVIALKYGRMMQQAFAEPGGRALQDWIDGCPNDVYAALCFQGGAAWRAKLLADIGGEPHVAELLNSRDDETLARLMGNLGGHDLELLLQTFESVADERPKLFLAYTVKGIGLPFQGHKDNHSGLMTEKQISAFRASMGIEEGREWEKFEGLPRPAEAYMRYLASVPFATSAERRHSAPRIAIPGREEFPRPTGKQSTQVAFRQDPERHRARRWRTRRCHCHDIARRDGLHKSRRLGEPARPVLPLTPRRRLPGRGHPVTAALDHGRARAAYRAGDRRAQSLSAPGRPPDFRIRCSAAG